MQSELLSENWKGMEIPYFWDVTPCILVDIYYCFGESYYSVLRVEEKR
jgi:hypothetical protein